LYYKKLKKEFLQMRQELQARLDQINNNEFASEIGFSVDKDWLKSLIYDELQDVEHALRKLEEGDYGRCEKTGRPFTENQIYVLPTARTIDDFDIQGYYAKTGYFSYD
jgi:DnaK suppressor protein